MDIHGFCETRRARVLEVTCIGLTPDGMRQSGRASQHFSGVVEVLVRFGLVDRVGGVGVVVPIVRTKIVQAGSIE